MKLYLVDNACFAAAIFVVNSGFAEPWRHLRLIDKKSVMNIIKLTLCEDEFQREIIRRLTKLVNKRKAERYFRRKKRSGAPVKIHE